MIKPFFLVLSLLLWLQPAAATKPVVEPPFWWVGMNNTKLQLLIRHPHLSGCSLHISYPGVRIIKVHHPSNPHYLFVDLDIAPDSKPGTFDLLFSKQGKTCFHIPYQLKKRAPDAAQGEGFGPSDIIYMLMPDRFANGNRDNDNRSGMKEKADYDNPDGRHGGDIQGIVAHLGYFSRMGFTALWINPLLENNMPKYSYHGYAITDFYRVDPRFGTNADYANLVAKAHKKGLKVIQDMVFNHCASEHWWMYDLPDSTWIHRFPSFTRSNYRSETIMDPHASLADKRKMSHGWFDRSMPDLNQNNPYLANYLIQNSIWWIEMAGIDGIRMDTWPYADQRFMSRWVLSVNKEYPHFSIVGETWLQDPAHTAWFQSTSFPALKTNTHLRSLTDFPLMYAIHHALNENEGWTEGLARIYITLSKDYLYPHPDSNLIFLDNHDVTRFASVINGDLAKFKTGLGLLLTLRGIPVLYYGTELMMEGKKEEGDGMLRQDFPAALTVGALDSGYVGSLSGKQNEALRFTRQMLYIRQKHRALQVGKLVQFIPEDGIYVFFRITPDEKIMVVVNHNTDDKSLDLSRFRELLPPGSSFDDLLRQSHLEPTSHLLVKANAITLLKVL